MWPEYGQTFDLCYIRQIENEDAVATMEIHLFIKNSMKEILKAMASLSIQIALGV